MNLKKIRKEKNITQQQVADVIGMSLQAYNHYENERREPDIETLNKLANYFEVSIDYLLDRETQESFNNKPKVMIKARGGMKGYQLTDEQIEALAKMAETLEAANKK